MFPPTPNTPVQLENIPCAVVWIQNPINNNPIYVGGLGDETPYVDKYFQGDHRELLSLEAEEHWIHIKGIIGQGLCRNHVIIVRLVNLWVL